MDKNEKKKIIKTAKEIIEDTEHLVILSDKGALICGSTLDILGELGFFIDKCRDLKGITDETLNKAVKIGLMSKEERKNEMIKKTEELLKTIEEKFNKGDK